MERKFRRASTKAEAAGSLPGDPDQAPSDVVAAPSNSEAKIALEMRLLERQLSRQGLLMEWLKAAAVPVAILGVLATSVVGLQQIRNAQAARADERFEKALSRLTSERTRDRLSGVSGLRLFLNDGVERRGDAVDALIDGMVTEDDPAVQDAILGVFAALKPTRETQPLLDHALEQTIRSNRSLSAKARSLAREVIWAEQRKIVATDLGIEPDQVPRPISRETLRKLSLQAYLRYLERAQPGIEPAGKSMVAPIKGLQRLMMQLLKGGAKTTDFSGISCDSCEFPKSLKIADADFSGAHLRGATFAAMDLTGAKFIGADLSAAEFDHVILDRAEFGRATNRYPTTFRCSRLRGADLRSFPLMTIVQSSDEGISLSESWGPLNETDAETKFSTRLSHITFIDDGALRSDAARRVFAEVKAGPFGPSAVFLGRTVLRRVDREASAEREASATAIFETATIMGSGDLRPEIRDSVREGLSGTPWNAGSPSAVLLKALGGPSSNLPPPAEVKDICGAAPGPVPPAPAPSSTPRKPKA